MKNYEKDFPIKGAPLGEAFGSRPRRGGGSYYDRFRKPLLWQTFASLLIFLVLIVIFTLQSPFALDLQQGFRFFIGSKASDWTPALETMVKNGIWLDSYDRQVFNQSESITKTAAEPLVPAIPVSGNMVLGFGKISSPVDSRVRYHNGIDITAARGEAVRACLAGVVRGISQDSGLGRQVEIDHGGGLRTLYANLGEILVAEGQEVEQGEIIAKLGGSVEPGLPHLHLEVWQYNNRIDPAIFLQSPDKIL